jgi:hypothetical protein
MVDPFVVGAGLNLLGGLMQGRSARRAARRQQETADEAAGRIRSYSRGAGERAGALEEFLPEYSTVSPETFRPVNLTTGYGSTRFNPETGQYEQTLSDPLAQQQRFSYGSAEKLAQQLGDFDPQAFAQQRFAGYQSLLQPQRESDTARFMGNLKRKGLLGWSQSQPGGERANPLAAGFQRAIGQQDEELALKAFGEGTAEQDRMARLQQQMFGQGMRLNEPLSDQMRYGYGLGGDEYRRAVEAAGLRNRGREGDFLNRQRMFELTEPFTRESELGGMDAQMRAAGLMDQARLASSTGLSQGMMDIGRGMYGGSGSSSRMPSMFSSYFGTSPSSAVSSEVSRLGGSTMNPFSGYWSGRDGWGSYGE